MDNFFEILIYLFIIFSFVSSFLKKKKKEEKKTDKPRNVHSESTQPVQDVKKTEPKGKDILAEIENLFNPPVLKKNEEEKESFGDLWQTETYDEHFEDSESHRPTPSEHQVTKSEHTQVFEKYEPVKVTYPTLKVEQPEETNVERMLEDDHGSYYSLTKKNEFILKLKDEFKDIDSLKKYIVISEILGKPKAFRR